MVFLHLYLDKLIRLFMNKIYDLIFIMVLGFFVGVPMGIMYPFTFNLRIIYIGLVVLCITIFFIGVKYRKARFGKVLIVFSLLLWDLLGVLGLGTGT